MGVNWLDLAIGGILLFSLVSALRNGVTKEVVRLVALLFGIVSGMWGYERLAVEYAPYITHEPLARFAAFGTIVIGCLFVGGLISRVLVKLWKVAGVRWFDRLLGAGFGLIRGLAIAAVLVLGLLAFSPIKGVEETVARSRLAPWVLYGAKAVALAAPRDLREAYGLGIERVRLIWNPPTPADPAENAGPVVRISPFPKSD